MPPTIVSVIADAALPVLPQSTACDWNASREFIVNSPYLDGR